MTLQQTERRIRRGANMVGFLWLSLVVLTVASLHWTGFVILLVGTTLAVVWAVLQELRSEVVKQIRSEGRERHD